MRGVDRDAIGHERPDRLDAGRRGRNLNHHIVPIDQVREMANAGHGRLLIA